MQQSVSFISFHVNKLIFLCRLCHTVVHKRWHLSSCRLSGDTETHAKPINIFKKVIRFGPLATEWTKHFVSSYRMKMLNLLCQRGLRESQRLHWDSCQRNQSIYSKSYTVKHKNTDKFNSYLCKCRFFSISMLGEAKHAIIATIKIDVAPNIFFYTIIDLQASTNR